MHPSAASAKAARGGQFMKLMLFVIRALMVVHQRVAQDVDRLREAERDQSTSTQATEIRISSFE